jgi:hypothetical protein
MMVEPLRVGRSCYSQGGIIQFGRYHESVEWAITVRNIDTGLVEQRATVHIPEAPSARARLGVWLKGWSENAGLPEALEVAGIVKLTTERWPAGYADARFAYLTEAALRQIEAEDQNL